MTEHNRKRLKTISDSNKVQVNTKYSNRHSQNNNHIQQKKIKKTSQPSTKKLYTVSVALPGSIIDNAQTIELKTYLAGQLARSFAIFNIDEIVIYDESGMRKNSQTITTQTDSHTKNKRDEGISSDPNVFLARILQYLETPQYLRKELFPVHQDLTYAGLLNPLDCPHHVRKEEKSPFREGVIIDKKLIGEASLVNAGLSKYVIIDKSIKPGIRVTLDMGNYEISKNDHQYIGAKVISPKVPKQHGLYWGYNIRIANSISKVFTECSYPDGYDVAIGTSERGKVVDEIIEDLPEFNHLLIVFGGLGGIEVAIDVDEDLKCSSEEADALFDLWINTCPDQGSRTIRTEEAVLITMSSLRAAISKKVPAKIITRDI